MVVTPRPGGGHTPPWWWSRRAFCEPPQEAGTLIKSFGRDGDALEEQVKKLEILRMPGARRGSVSKRSSLH